MLGALALPLATSFPCRVAEGAGAVRHRVVVAEDWRLDTGHDEDLEQIAGALGGGASCLRELPLVLPALRLWWQRATRRAGPVIRSDDGGPIWRAVDGTLGCCPARGFRDPILAAAHARDVVHVAAVAGAHRRALRHLVGGIEGEVDPLPPPMADGQPATPLVAAAWACGLHPEWLGRFAEALPDTQAAEGMGVLLALSQTGADPTWVRTSASDELLRIPARDPDGLHAHLVGLLVWLSWTMTELDREEPSARASWLATGARRQDIVTLSSAGYLPDAARELGLGWGMTLPGAAQLLGRWVDAGYRPRPAELVALRDAGLGFGPMPPGQAAVRRLADLLGVRRLDPSVATVLALEIARRGTVGAAQLALRGTEVRLASA
jgi:hypothetical protein